jgi:NAD(P)-dependent dehydrogenase (short-subunit alcohol dehydrogenase family)
VSLLGRDRSLEGRVALVTGAASGIGAATASTLAFRGASVIVSDHNLAAATRVAGVIGAVPVKLDVRSDEAWGALLARSDLPGPITMAHLNAGRTTRPSYPYAIEDVSVDEVSELFDVNVIGTVNGLRHLVPVMEAAGGGSIAITSSLAGVVPFGDEPLYAASKHALIGLATSLAESLAVRGITVNVVCPGTTDTAMISAGRRAVAAQRAVPLMPPERVAGVVVSLLTCAQYGEVWAVTSERGVFRMDRPHRLGRPFGG